MLGTCFTLVSVGVVAAVNGMWFSVALVGAILAALVLILRRLNDLEDLVYRILGRRRR